jgi:Transposase DDE domain group 1
MTGCNQLAFEFPGFRGRKIGADFGGGNVSSDGGLLLLRQVDRFSGLIKNLAKVLPDYRDPDRIILRWWEVFYQVKPPKLQHCRQKNHIPLQRPSNESGRFRGAGGCG